MRLDILNMDIIKCRRKMNDSGEHNFNLFVKCNMDIVKAKEVLYFKLGENDSYFMWLENLEELGDNEKM